MSLDNSLQFSTCDLNCSLARELGAAGRSRLALAQQSRWLEITLENISQGIVMIDPDGYVRVCNREAAQILDAERLLAAGPLQLDDLARHNWERFQEAGVAVDNRFEDFLERFRISGQLWFEELPWPDGRVFQLRNMPLPGGGGVATYTDITHAKRAEQELVAARDRAQSGERAKSEFLAAMSHEIRSPLSGLIGVIEMLGESGLDPGQAEMARMAREAAAGLLLVLNEVLDFSKIEAGAMAISAEPIDLRGLVSGVAHPYRLAASRHGVLLDVDVKPRTPEWVHTDPLRLRQILNNFLSNANKFTLTGRIDLAVGVEDDDETPSLFFEVRDTGIGMSEDVLARIFEPFLQADATTTRRFGGTGLGLSISQKLAGLLGGRIDVDSAPGAGSAFTLRLPLIEANAPEIQSTNETHVGGGQLPAGARALVVDDDATLRWLTTRQLERLGFVVESSANGAEALRRVEAGGLSLMLTDCHMPQMDGIALTEAIRALPDPQLRGLPIFGLTADATPSTRQRGLAAGMNNLAVKPLKLAALAQTLWPYLPPSATTRPEEAKTSAPPSREAPFDDSMYRDLFEPGDAEGAGWLAECVDALKALAGALASNLAPDNEEAVLRAQARETAHSLAGAALTLGAKRVGAAARAFEGAAPEEATGKLRARFDDLKAEIAAAERAIAAYLAPDDAQAA